MTSLKKRSAKRRKANDMTILSVLLEITVYSAVIFAAIVLFKRLLKDKMSPVLHLAVWLMLIIRLLLPVTFDASVYFIRIPGEIVQIDSGAGDITTSQTAEEFLTKSGEAGQTANASPAVSAAASQTREEERIQMPVLAGEPVNWPAILIVIWTAGMAVFAAMAVSGYIRLRRNLRQSVIPSTERLEALFNECKSELRIRGRVKLRVQRFAQSPALLFPVDVLIPADVTEMEERQIRLAMMHELTHYKRKDQLFALLLLALRIVYWFNPVVHIAELLIRDDIETVCDSSVVKRLNPAEKGVYARCLISMYKNMPETQMVLGMALCGTRKSAEKRIRGIYMKQKSQWRVKLTAALLAGVMAVCCFTTACQPTPDKPVIVNKNQSYDEIISGDNGKTPEGTIEPYTVPERLTENIEEGNLKIHADVPIELPQTADFPVTIVKQKTFTQDEVDNIVNYFAQGRKMYKRKTFKTKDEILDMITEAKRGPLDGGVYDPAQADENWINELEQRYKDAPDSFEKKYVDSTLDYCTGYDGTPLNSGEKAELNVNIENDKGIEETLHVMNANELYHSSEAFYRNGSGYYDETFYRENLDAPDIDAGTDPNFRDWENQIKNTSMTEDEAIAQGSAILEALKIDGLALVGVDRAAILDDNSNPCKGGYELTYMSSKGKLTGFYSDYWVMSQAPGEKMPEYAPPFEQERIEIMLNEDGIHVFSWVGIAMEDETVNDHAQLKPFEEIKQAAFNQIKYKYSFGAHDEWHIRYEILSAKLYLGYIGVKDDLSKALMVPMWVFVTQIYSQHDSQTQEFKANREAVAVNALDGSIVSTN